MPEIPCNCFHVEADHHQLEAGFRGWCIYSEYGQCPCDRFTPMDNLEFLEYKSE